MNARLSRESTSVCRGFTLIELLVTITILAIVAVLAVPSLETFVLNNRIRAQSTEFTTSFALARSEAVNRSARVVIRPVCSDSDCSGTSWESGWLVFVDTPPYDAVHDDDEEKEVKLEIHEPLGGNNTLRGTTEVSDYVSFDYDGRAAQFGTFILCDKRGFGADARAIKLLATGRIRALSATDSSENSCTP